MRKMKEKSRTRMKNEDVSSWVEHYKQRPQPSIGEYHVRFEEPEYPEGLVPTKAEEEELDGQPIYTEGGFKGWFVVFASFINHAICDGASFSFGIFFVAIQVAFTVDRVAAMIPSSCFMSLPLILAPVAGMFSDRFGCRRKVIFGASMAFCSCALACFCPSIWIITTLFAFAGFGMAFIYNASICSVTYHFFERRGLATSLAVSGTGVGTFVFPVYLTKVVDVLKAVVPDLQSLLVAYAVGYMIIVILAVFTKDVEWESDTPDYKRKKFELSLQTIHEDEDDTKNNKEPVLRRANSLPNLNMFRVDVGSIQSVVEVGRADGKTEVPVRSKSMAQFANQNQLPIIQEYSMINTNLANLEHLDLELANSPCTTVRAHRRRVISKVSMSVDQINEMDDEDFRVNHLFQGSTDSSDEESSSDDSEMSNDGDSSSSELSEKQLDESTSKLINNLTVPNARDAASAPASARLIRYSLAPGTNNISGGRILASNALQPKYATNLLKMGKMPSAPMLAVRKKRKVLYRTQKSIKKRLAEEKDNYSKIISCRPYLDLALSVSLLYFILDIPYVCLYEYAMEELAMTETEGKMIYSVIGVCNFCSTIVFGKLADYVHTRGYIHWIYMASVAVVGLTLFAAAFATSIVQIMVSATFFGLFVTSNYALQSILITLCFDKMSHFQSAYSLISLLEGIASFIGPTIFAVIREHTGSYKIVFLIGGGLSLLSALSMHNFSVALAKQEDEREDATPSPAITNGITRQNGYGTGAEAETLLDV